MLETYFPVILVGAGNPAAALLAGQLELVCRAITIATFAGPAKASPSLTLARITCYITLVDWHCNGGQNPDNVDYNH